MLASRLQKSAESAHPHVIAIIREKQPMAATVNPQHPGHSPLCPWSWRISSAPSDRPKCILFASFFAVRQYSGSVAVVALIEDPTDSGQTRILTNSSEQAAIPITSSLRNWVSGVRIPPGAPQF